MKRKVIFLFAFLFIGIFVISGLVSATDFSACNTTLLSNRVYNLTADINISVNSSTATCFAPYNNVIFDCNGYRIYGDKQFTPSWASGSILIYGSNVTIQNCNFEVNTTAIGGTTSNLTVKNNTFTSNGNRSYYHFGSNATRQNNFNIL
jgi:hypothetical protein